MTSILFNFFWQFVFCSFEFCHVCILEFLHLVLFVFCSICILSCFYFGIFVFCPVVFCFVWLYFVLFVLWNICILSHQSMGQKPGTKSRTHALTHGKSCL